MPRQVVETGRGTVLCLLGYWRVCRACFAASDSYQEWSASNSHGEVVAASLRATSMTSGEVSGTSDQHEISRLTLCATSFFCLNRAGVVCIVINSGQIANFSGVLKCPMRGHVFPTCLTASTRLSNILSPQNPFTYVITSGTRTEWNTLPLTNTETPVDAVCLLYQNRVV